MPGARTAPIRPMFGEGKALDLTAALQAGALGLFDQLVTADLARGLAIGGALTGEAVLDVFGLAGVDQVVGDGGLGLVAARVGAWVVGAGPHPASLPLSTGSGQAERSGQQYDLAACVAARHQGQGLPHPLERELD